jgi:hypothetical protein
MTYSVRVVLTSRRYRRARDERRRMSSYVTKVVLEGLRNLRHGKLARDLKFPEA